MVISGAWGQSCPRSAWSAFGNSLDHHTQELAAGRR